VNEIEELILLYSDVQFISDDSDLESTHNLSKYSNHSVVTDEV
jgi:hypothetical protein